MITLYAPLCGFDDMTLLNDFIFILCASYFYVSIGVYENTTPFDLLLLLPLEEIKAPSGLVSSVASECLYFMDIKTSCIWKITIEDYRVTKWLCNLNTPSGLLTVSNDGQVVVLQHGQWLTDNCLDIYGSDAVFIRRIYLSNDIYLPLNAIMKPNGQFVIVHWGDMRTKDMNQSDVFQVASLVTSAGQIIDQAHSTETVSIHARDAICNSPHPKDVSKCSGIRLFIYNVFLMLDEYSSYVFITCNDIGYGSENKFNSMITIHFKF